MTLADRLNQIISEQKITKLEFAERLGISVNYVYILTGKQKKEATTVKVNASFSAV